MTTVLAPPDDEPAAPTASRWQRLGLAAPAYIPALIVAIGGWQHRWLDEDAFINLRIVDQIFAGHGPVFNAGERVEASTSTLWIVVLVIGRAIFGAFTSMEWITLFASLIAAVAAFVVAGKAVRRLHAGEDGLVVPVGLILVASVAVVWDFSTSGLEMGLVWLWIAASWYVLVSVARTDEINGRQRAFFGVLLGLGPLVRPDLTLDDDLFPRRVVRARPAAVPRLRSRRDLRTARRVPDLPHGLLRHTRTHHGAGQGRGRAAPRPGMGVRAELHRPVPAVAHGDTRRRDDCVPDARAPRPPRRDRNHGDARGRARARAVHHRHRRRLHARSAAVAGLLRARAPRVGRVPPTADGRLWSA